MCTGYFFAYLFLQMDIFDFVVFDKVQDIHHGEKEESSRKSS